MKRLVPVFIFGGLALVPVLQALGVPVGGYVPLLLGRVMVFALAAMSLDLILGIGGLVSFGHAAPLAIGAYAVAMLDAANVQNLAVVVPCAMAASALFAASTGALALRTRGVNFIMITLAFAQMIYFAAGSLSDYGGDDGYSLYSRTQLFGLKLLDGRAFYVTALVVLLLGWLFLRMLVASRFGRTLSAIRQNRARVQALGFSTFAVELTAMTIAAMICSVAGVLLANEAEFVSPAYASWSRSGDLMVMVILGGAGSLHGAILGALVVVLAQEALGQVTPHWALIFGPALILAVLFLRHGMAGLGARRG
jgi:branched-chain amino acid transport system permease protein